MTLDPAAPELTKDRIRDPGDGRQRGWRPRRVADFQRQYAGARRKPRPRLYYCERPDDARDHRSVPRIVGKTAVRRIQDAKAAYVQFVKILMIPFDSRIDDGDPGRRLSGFGDAFPDAFPGGGGLDIGQGPLLRHRRVVRGELKRRHRRIPLEHEKFDEFGDLRISLKRGDHLADGIPPVRQVYDAHRMVPTGNSMTVVGTPRTLVQKIM